MSFLRQILLASVAVAVASTAAQYEPTCDIENGFDYAGNDIGNVRSDIGGCCHECIVNDKCKAWTWTNYNNGTCWLKSGMGSIVVNADAKSSRLPGRYFIGAGNYYNDVDFAGNDIGNEKTGNARDCFNICRKKLGCRAYSWNNNNGGTCWLKSKRSDELTYKPGVTSAEAYMSTVIIGPVEYALEKDVDYVGNDLSSVSGVPLSKCNELCSNQYQAGCRAFSYNNHQGGTCWLKRARTETKANSGVTSGVPVQPIAF